MGKLPKYAAGTSVPLYAPCIVKSYISHMDDFLVPQEWLHSPPQKIIHIDRFDMCLMFFPGCSTCSFIFGAMPLFCFFFVAPEGATALLGKLFHLLVDVGWLSDFMSHHCS